MIQVRCEYAAKDVLECIADARRHVDLLVGRAVAMLNETETQELRAVAKLARDLNTNLGGATVMLDEMNAWGEREVRK